MSTKEYQAGSLKLLETIGFSDSHELLHFNRRICEIAESKESKLFSADHFLEALYSGLMIDRSGRGYINLTEFVLNEFTPSAKFNFEQLSKLVAVAFRFLDNLHLGFTTTPIFSIDGLADTLVMLGYRYDTIPARKQAELIVRTLRNYLLDNSIRLAAERGKSKSFESTKYLAGQGACAVPRDVRKDIVGYGLRVDRHLWLHGSPKTGLSYFNGTSPEALPPLNTVYAWKVKSKGFLNESIDISNYACLRYRQLFDSVAPEQFLALPDITLVDIDTMRKAIGRFIDGMIMPLDQRVTRFALTIPNSKTKHSKRFGNQPRLQAHVL